MGFTIQTAIATSTHARKYKHNKSCSFCLSNYFYLKHKTRDKVHAKHSKKT